MCLSRLLFKMSDGVCSGPMIEKLIVTCGTKMEVTAWLEVLRNLASGKPAPNPVSVKPQSLQVLSSTCSSPSSRLLGVILCALVKGCVHGQDSVRE